MFFVENADMMEDEEEQASWQVQGLSGSCSERRNHTLSERLGEDQVFISSFSKCGKNKRELHDDTVVILSGCRCLKRSSCSMWESVLTGHTHRNQFQL